MRSQGDLREVGFQLHQHVSGGAFAPPLTFFLFRTSTPSLSRLPGRIHTPGSNAEPCLASSLKAFRLGFYGVRHQCSFHCHVSEDITPTEKQDLEYRFWEKCNGGKIQYVRYPEETGGLRKPPDFVLCAWRRTFLMGESPESAR